MSRVMMVIGGKQGEKKRRPSSMYPSIGLGSQQVQPLDEGERIDVQGRTQPSLRTACGGTGACSL